MLLLVVILAGCNKSDIPVEKTKVVEETVESSKDHEKAAEDTEDKEQVLWPDAFQRSKEGFSFPASLAVAENIQKGIWWEKIEHDHLTKEEEAAAVETLQTVIKGEASKEEKADQIKRFVAETYFPDLPSMSTYTPRGKINLEEVESTSNIKLNGRELKENIHIAIILDASGSMKNVQDGKTLMEMAKESIEDFASNLPDKAKVSLTIYGHKGTGSEADKKLSCSSIEEIYPLSTYDADIFATELESIAPSGWTSMAASLTQVGEKLAVESNEESTNVIYLVSDGKETCDGNPVEAAKQLADSNINPIINVIGLAVQSEDANELQKIAESAEGRYINVKNQQELDKEFQESNNSIQQWIDWHRQNTSEAIDQLMEDKQRLMDLNEQTVDRLMLFLRHAKQTLMDLNKTQDLDQEVYNIVFEDLENFYNTMYREKDELYTAKFKTIEETYNSTKSEIDETYNNNF